MPILFGVEYIHFEAGKILIKNAGWKWDGGETQVFFFLKKERNWSNFDMHVEPY